jgi:hypothetical protein
MALLHLDAVLLRVEAAAHSVFVRHKPVYSLILILSAATSVIVATVTFHAVRWFFAVGLGLGSAVLAFFLLSYFRFSAWRREHPLLAEYFQSRFLGRHKKKQLLPVDMTLSESVVRVYLPTPERQALLDDLEEAKTRVRALSGR